MIIDAHVHCSGSESADEVLRTLDTAGVDMAVLLAPFLDGGVSRLHDRDALCAGNRHLSRVVRSHGDRLVGFAVVNPDLPDAPSDVERAIEEGLRGLKMVPGGWYPYDACAHRVYAKAEELDLPILFHSGIFIDGRSGRYCQPVFFEALREHPRLRVTLAHMGWPWCDEANAVGLIDLINGVAPDRCQFRFDISFGPPPIYRRGTLERALAVLGPELLQFGSDRFLPCDGASIRTAINEVEVLFDELCVSAAQRRRIFSGTAAAWLGGRDDVHHSFT